MPFAIIKTMSTFQKNSSFSLKAKRKNFGIKASLWRALEKNRKEVIQPHVPVRLPCYDLAPIMKFTVSQPKSGFG